ncbi:2-oxo acid dehydrogenase subunit E2 [Streptomyces sp. p1417]|uniref:Dihydrolipoamide acetyltransferase component of pyruvate dehydrogenase complex n=1 Tax=Streptomyces typhae TaxID=2681492 RepID=A0A6L6X527_9ACTN|nr:dihydrolipoamide acetyltransferase family protein [Streptomyces typhae]MVO88965.1 2-oxo acid dehydrogenase subunit E2 [Streptomyces typhae]
MAQVLEFKLPDLGEGLTEAEITRWLVEVGDVVEVDQPVVEVETAKAMVEVPCPYGGVVTARFGAEGTELPVGAPLLTVAVGAPAGDLDGAVAGGPAADQGSGDPDARAVGGGAAAAGDDASGNVLVGYGTTAPPARRRRVRPPEVSGAPTGAGAGAGAAGRGTGDASLRGPGGPGDSEDPGQRNAARSAPRGSKVPEAGAAPARGDGPVPVISPLVRRLARENGVDLRQLVGSGPDGLILRADVEDAVRAAATVVASVAGPVPASGPVSTATEGPVPGIGGTFRATGTNASLSASTGASATTVTAGAGTRGASDAGASGTSASGAGAGGTGGGGTGSTRGKRIPLRGVRGAVADKLARSRREIPDATCWVDADATELMNARAAMNAAGGPKVSLLALLARVCTAALARHPELNSTVDMDAREVVQLDEVHLGFAAQTERGLVVPVVKGAHARDTESLSAELARLSEAARTGTLTPGELTGSTFTLNNYGVFGVDGSTPIINHPEAAMLGVGRIVPKPWVHQGELAVRQVVQLSLTFDHRVCDGGTAGGFLRFVADCVEQPAVLLRSV